MSALKVKKMGSQITHNAPRNPIEWMQQQYKEQTTKFSNDFDKAINQPMKPSNGAMRFIEGTFVGEYKAGIQQALSPTIIAGLRAAGFHDLARMCNDGAYRNRMQAKLNGHNTNSAGAQYGRLVVDKYPWLVGIMAAATPAGRALLVKLIQNEKAVHAGKLLNGGFTLLETGQAVVSASEGKKKEALGHAFWAATGLGVIQTLKMPNVFAQAHKLNELQLKEITEIIEELRVAGFSTRVNNASDVYGLSMYSEAFGLTRSDISFLYRLAEKNGNYISSNSLHRIFFIKRAASNFGISFTQLYKAAEKSNTSMSEIGRLAGIIKRGGKVAY